MYESFFGFKDTPFRLSADEKFRYAHKNYLRASAYLAYALQQSEGFVMITGRPGSGKTTLVRDVISEIDENNFHALHLVTSQLQAEELLRKVALEYGLPAESYNKATLLTSINRHLSDLHEQGMRSILFLDEAQNLSLNGLEELRLLSNLQKGNNSLLQIVLIGHDELRELVLGPEMEHIQQRLIATCQIKPMSSEQTREYIIHRLSVVGWQDDPRMDDDAFELIHQVAQGVPRKINHLMSRLLLFAALEEKHELSEKETLTIIEELVDEHRISLANDESFESFVQRYRAEKQQREQEQQVAYQKAAVHDIFENQPFQQEQFFNNDDETVKRQELIASTNHITENLLNAIDASSHDFEEAWDLPDSDSDWANWESDLTVKKELPLAASNEDYTPDLEGRSLGEEGGELPAEDEEEDVSLPSADEIWNSDMDSGVMDSLKHKKKPNPTNTYEVPQETKLPSLEDEHRGAGVWGVSKEKRERASVSEGGSKTVNRGRSSLPLWSDDEPDNKISVDENLSVPSLWVESCPEVTTPQNTWAYEAKHQPRRREKLSSFISRIASWVGIGLLVVLAYYFFSAQIDSYWSVFVEHLTGGEEEGFSSTMAPDSSGIEENPVLNMSNQPQPKALSADDSLQDDVSGEISEGLQEGVSAQAGYSDVDTNENISLATRYSVYFDFNKASIPNQYVPLLKSVQQKMVTDENTFLRIIGYADSQGNSDYNYQLSLKRAEEVKQFFVMRGIGGDRLHVAAVGAVQEEVQRVLNPRESARRRRVELILFPY
jgi:type II secretory pathway predicted ATPase ExeA/outer membrane protein OmpA-like peptidoglycan-associated protein